MSQWPMVPLAQVAKPIARPIQVEAGKPYRTIGVRWWGEGAYERQTIDGSETAAKSLSLVCEGDLIINKIWVRHGSTAIATKAVGGCVASNEFPTFDLDRHQVWPKWIHWLTKTKWFWGQCDALSMGTSGKNRIKPEKFLTISIPLPPLIEQRRLVERIDILAAKIDEAKRLRRLATVQAGFLTKAALDDVFDQVSACEHWPRVPLRDAALIARGKFTHRPRNEPRFYGGTFPFIQIGDISDSRLYIRRFSQTLNEDGLRISRMFPRGTVVIAITGATVGVTGILDFDSCFPDSIVGIQPIPGVSTSEFIYWAVEFEKHKALSQATQTTQPNINLKNIDSLTLPLPSVDEQNRLIGYISQINGKADLLGNSQIEVQAELDAMLPAILDRAFNGKL